MAAHPPGGEPAGPAFAERLAALRARGAPAFDPVRWCYLDALARRMAPQRGDVRRLLEQKLDLAIAAFDKRLAAARPAPGPGAAQAPSPLAELMASLDRPATELRALSEFRSTWARLGVERQLSRSQASVPGNPGPLNSQLLVLRSLRLMQEISPAYLGRFMAHVETLMWLDRATAPRVAPPRDRARKPGRGKSTDRPA